MDASEITTIIESEIAGDWTRSNYHGVDLRECLVPPRKCTFCNGFPQLNEGKPVELWIVLEELPGEKEGYLIVCDDSGTQFGLADWNGSNPPVLLGFHGTFLDALAAM